MLKLWQWADGNKTKIAGYIALVLAAIQWIMMDEFKLNPIWWQHVVSIGDKIAVGLGGVGVGHKLIKFVQAKKNGG